MTQTAEKQDFFIVNRIQGAMGRYDTSSDLLHTDLLKKEASPFSIETHYFGFNVPEANIDGLCYAVHRPNLGVLYGGVQVFQGIKGDMLASELFDIRNYMSDDAWANDLTSYRLDCGYEFKIVEPGRKWHLHYDDPVRKNSFDIDVTPASDPIVWPNGRHFEQTMHNRGELVLRGKRYKVDSYHVRDRSWEGARLERHETMPAITWTFGVLDETLSFQFSGFDHPDLDPEWKDHFTVKAEDTLKGGWLWQDGEAAFLASARSRVTRNRKTLYPEALYLEITDTKGRHLKLRGTVTAAAPTYPFVHQRGMLCQTRWEMDDGRILWGETQEAHYSDYLNAMMPKD